MRTIAAVALLLVAGGVRAQEADRRAFERALLEELIEIDTSDGTGGTAVAARVMARHLRAAGLPEADIQILEHRPGYANLVARLRGTGARRPILLMAHMDVVPALASDWSFDPFEFREQDGYYFGRGTSDNKAGVAAIVANLVRLKREGFVPNRDLIAVLTGDEETTMDGIRWLVSQRRDLIDAALALNSDGGGGELRDGEPSTFSIQASEKVYVTWEIEFTNPGGHSSLPVPDNAIYRLAQALVRLSEHRFPMRLNEVTREYFARTAERAAPGEAADIHALLADGDAAAADRLSSRAWYNSLLRTTCVATQLAAGHAENALPQSARAVVNCRVLPDEDPAAVEATLRSVIGDEAAILRRIYEPVASPPSPLDPEVVAPIAEVVQEVWPGALIVPEMSTGATDGLYVRNGGIPVYGVSGIFAEPDDVRAHGRDERIGVEAFHDAVRFWYGMIKALSAP
jgi:acetylornithine deacetylase/succinyl-diaminopimelate desuccinylase-like protein